MTAADKLDDPKPRLRTPTKIARWQVTGMTGRDALLELLLPRGMFVRWLANRLRANLWPGWDAEENALLFQYQGEWFRILPDGTTSHPDSDLLRG